MPTVDEVKANLPEGVVVYRAKLAEAIDFSGARIKVVVESGGSRMTLNCNSKALIEKLEKAPGLKVGVEGGWGVKDRQVKGVVGKPDWVSHDLVSLHKPEEGQPLPARRGGGGGRGYGKSPEEMRSIEMQVVFKGAMEAVIVGKLDAHEAVDVALQVWHDVVRGF